MLRFLARTRLYPLQALVALACPRAFLRAWLRATLPADRTRPGELYGLSLSFDIDRERDVAALPELLTLLRAHGLSASFAMIGAYARRFPAEHRAVAEAGFEVLNHTFLHPNHADLCPDRFFDRLPAEELRREVEDGHRAIREVCGVETRAFRAPHFGDLHTEAVYPLLADLGYACSSSEAAIRSPFGGLPYRIAAPAAGGPRPEALRLCEFPVSTCPDHPHSVFDSWHGLERGRPWHARPGRFTAALEALVAIQRKAGGYVNVYFDPAAIVGLPDRERFFAILANAGRAATTYAGIASSSFSLD